MHEPSFTRHTWIDQLHRRWDFPLLERLETHIHSLSRGDRFIFSLLTLLVITGALLSLYLLEQRALVEVPTRGGILVEGSLGSPQFINPILAISDADRDLSSLTHAGLMGLTGDGSLIPVLAESYEVSEDGKRYTFSLRPDARFFDGTPVTAEDIVFTIHKAQDPALKSPEYANWSGVAVLALDPHTVRFTLPKPYAPFLNLTTLGILSERAWKNVASNEFAYNTLETNPVGAGPFKIRTVTRDSNGLIKSVELIANDSYALGRPYLDGLTMKFYASTDELVSAVRGGDIESVYDIPSSHALSAPYSRVFGVFWNPSEKQVYARPEVRKALSLAINREALIEEVLHGLATPIMGPVPPGSGISQASVPTSATALQDAARTLTDAGWVYDGTNQVWKHAAAKQTLDRITLRTSNVPEFKSVASAIKTYWERLGIPVAIEFYEPGDLTQNVIRPRKYEALLYGMVIGRDQDLYAFWDSQERNDPGLNIASYVNKTVDALLEDARQAADKKEQRADLEKIEAAVALDYPAAFLYAPDFTYVVPPDLRGVSLPQITMPSDRFATVATWYRETDRVWPFFVHY